MDGWIDALLTVPAVPFVMTSFVFLKTIFLTI